MTRPSVDVAMLGGFVVESTLVVSVLDWDSAVGG